MTNFRSQVESILFDIFEEELVPTKDIENVAEQADSLHSALESNDDFDYDLSIDIIEEKMEERASNGAKGAWNSWIGQLERYGIVPKGHQI